jgi:hypothetical protein
MYRDNGRRGRHDLSMSAPADVLLLDGQTSEGRETTPAEPEQHTGRGEVSYFPAGRDWSHRHHLPEPRDLQHGRQGYVRRAAVMVEVLTGARSWWSAPCTVLEGAGTDSIGGFGEAAVPADLSSRTAGPRGAAALPLLFFMAGACPQHLHRAPDRCLFHS